MKKVFLLLILSLFIVFLFVGCKKEPEAQGLKVGTKSPYGGFIFYDCDADNDSGNADGLISSECGWRYLEAAPIDFFFISGSSYVVTYGFGYCRTSAESSNTEVGTKTAIGTGKENTSKLHSSMGEKAYEAKTGSKKLDYYAASVCEGFSTTGDDGLEYDGWFLPSKDELNLMYTNLYEKGLGPSFSNSNYYWSSSEYDGTQAWCQDFNTGKQYIYTRDYTYLVRLVRAFK